jgi:hypothetical protein
MRFGYESHWFGDTAVEQTLSSVAGILLHRLVQNNSTVTSSLTMDRLLILQGPMSMIGKELLHQRQELYLWEPLIVEPAL